MRWLPLLLIPLAGCLSDEVVADDPIILHDATGCSLGVAVLVRPHDHLDALLPAGYVSADAQGLLGLPIPAGQGAALFSAYTCAHGQWTDGPLEAAELNILVEDPQHDDHFADAHYYLLRYFGQGPIADRLAADGWQVENATEFFVREDPDVPLPGFASIYVEAEAGAVAFTIQAPAPQTLDTVSRFWHETPEGPASFQYVMAADVQAGTAIVDFIGNSVEPIAADAARPLTSLVEIGIWAPELDWIAHYQPA